MPSPNVGTLTSELRDVVALDRNEAIGVGLFVANFGQGLISQTLIERWDGVEWTVVPSSNGLDSDELTGVAAVSSEDAWAVGSQIDDAPEGNTSYALIEHWDGSAWSIVPTPNVVENSDLNDVAG